VSKAVKIGPQLPTDLSITRIDTDAPATAAPVVTEAPSDSVTDDNTTDLGDGTRIVRTTDIHGNTVETRMGVAKVQHETKAQVQARVVSSYTDVHGNLVETY